MKNKLKKSVYEYLKNYPSGLKLFKELKKYSNFYLIGGVLREFEEYNYIKNIRDIDIIIETSEKEICKNILKKYNPKINIFGGYKINFNNLSMDIWFLENTWSYCNNIINCNQEKYGERLTDTVFLNIDGIVYNWNLNILDDEKYRKCIKNKKIDVVLDKNPYIELNILRAIIFKKQYNFKFSKKLSKIILYEKEKNKDLQIKLFEIQKNRYKKEILSLKEIENEIDKIRDEFYGNSKD